MTKRLREQRREKFLEMITAGERTRAAGVELAAALLGVSVHTVNAWLKPESSRSSNEIPTMAIELLEFKLAGKTRQEELAVAARRELAQYEKATTE